VVGVGEGASKVQSCLATCANHTQRETLTPAEWWLRYAVQTLEDGQLITVIARSVYMSDNVKLGLCQITTHCTVLSTRYSTYPVYIHEDLFSM
jgi:hypothetical protein